MSSEASTSGLVVASLEPWDHVWRRNQHLVATLLRADPELRVLFVEPPHDMSRDVRVRRVPHRGAGLRPGPTLAGVGEGRLWLYQPTKLLPRRVAPGFDRAVARRVLRLANRVGLTRPAVWVNDPSSAPLAELAPARTLYDVTDDWLMADRPARERDRLRRAEDLLLHRCDVVTVCSPALAAAKGRDRSVVLVTNAVDVDRYRAPAPRPADLPDGAVALYLGTLHDDRLDLELCVRTAAELARAPRGATLVLVGPDATTPAQSARLRRAGILLLGARASAAVPAYLQHADVLVVPHVVTPFTDSLDPLKLYEYLAVGRPVVSTPVAGFRDRNLDQVAVVPPRDFPAAVAAGVRLSSPTVAAPTELPTWARQAELIADSLRA